MERKIIYLMRKLLLCFLLIITINYTGNTQENPYVIGESPYSGIESVSVLKYTLNASVLVKMNEIEATRTLIISDTEGNQLFETVTEENEVILQNLQFDQTYIFSYSDDFIDEVLEEEIYVSSDDEFDLAVSMEMFDAISEFVQQEEINVLDYLMGDESILAFDAYSFYQRFTEIIYESNEPTESDPIIVAAAAFIPPTNTSVPNQLPCKCSVITTQEATPAGSPFFKPNGTINNTPISNVNPAVTFNSNSHGWHYRYNIGPAKAHMIWTQGSRSGGTDRQYSYLGMDESEISPNYAAVGYHLLCLKGDGVIDKNCQCSTDLCVTYKYDTKSNAMAILKKALFSKNSQAVNEDVAIFVEENITANQTTTLDAGMVSSSSGCSVTINPEWYVQLLEVLGVIGGVVLEGDITADDLDEFIDETGELITTNYQTFEGNCGTVENDVALLNDDFCKPLASNTPMMYRLYSFSNQVVGGKRSWVSQAYNVSNFLLAGVAEPDALDDLCCIDGAANWVVGSAYGAPVSDGNLRTSVGNFMYLLYPFFNLPQNPFTNGYQLPQSMGSTSIEVCDPGGTSNQDINKKNTDFALRNGMSEDRDIKVLSIHDSSGAKVSDFANRDFQDLPDLKSVIKSELNSLPMGIYILRYSENGRIKAEKMMIGF